MSSHSSFDFKGAFTQRSKIDSRSEIYGTGQNSFFIERLYPELSNNPKKNSTLSWRPIQVKQYKQLRKVGSGTYGTVYLSKAPNNSTVALKHLIFDNEKEGFPITAIREIKLLQSLKHPNIVQLYDIVTDFDNKKGMQIFMVFEYLEHDISGLIHNPNVKLSISNIKHFMYQLFNALDYCHTKVHILHRDIKTANLLVDDFGNVKIADFGLARQFIPQLSTKCNERNECKIIAHEHQSCAYLQRRYTNTVVTLWYRAPELLLTDSHYSSAIDMWSIGCVFAELLLKQPLFKGKYELQQFMQIIDILGYPCSKHWPAFMQLADKLNLRVKTKQKRFQSSNGKLRQKFNDYNEKALPNEILDDVGYNLMKSLLLYNPMKRMSANEALQSKWFESYPCAIAPDFSNLLSSHDLEARQHKKYGFKKNSQLVPVLQQNQSSLNQSSVVSNVMPTVVNTSAIVNQSSFYQNSKQFLNQKRNESNRRNDDGRYQYDNKSVVNENRKRTLEMNDEQFSAPVIKKSRLESMVVEQQLQTISPRLHPVPKHAPIASNVNNNVNLRLNRSQFGGRYDPKRHTTNSVYSRYNYRNQGIKRRRSRF